MTDSFQRINPFTAEPLEILTYDSDFRIEEKLKNLTESPRLLPRQRQNFLQSLSANLKQDLEILAGIMADETGKPVTQGRAEVLKSAATLDYFANFSPPAPAKNSNFEVVKEPLGLVFAIMPWNFPLWQIVRFLAPGLALGNRFLVKPADLSAGTGLALQACLDRAAHDLGFSQAPAAVTLATHAQAAQVIRDPRVNGVTFTGSVNGGRSVAELAGRALKKSVLELGGSDPYLVFADADVALAAKFCAQSRMQNAGQSCVAAKRFFVHKKVRDEFLEAFLKTILSLKAASPRDAATELGPLVAARMKRNLLSQIESLEKNFKVQALQIENNEFKILEKTCEAFLAPRWMDFGAAENFHDRWNEELFGPVSCLWTFDDEKAALRAANNSSLGLGAAVFSKDLEKAWFVASQLECGLVAVNEMVKSDPKYPFGGVKNSGYGRELGSEGYFEFANTKSITGLV